MQFLKIFVFLAILALAFSSGEWQHKEFSLDTQGFDSLAYSALQDKLGEEQHQHMKLVSIDDCYTQVVNGINYLLYVTVEVDGKQEQYQTVIYVQPSTEKYEVVSFQQAMQFVRSSQNDEEMTGGSSVIDWADNNGDKQEAQIKKNIQKLISDKLKAMGEDPNFTIEKAASQVVSGIKYILDIKSGNDEFEVSVLSEPWNKVLEILGINKVDEDGNVQQQQQQQQPQQNKFQGAVQDLDWESNDIITGALRKDTENFIASSLAKQGVEDLKFKIVRAQYQVVAGIRLILTVEAENRTFEVTLLSQPWTSEKFQLLGVSEQEKTEQQKGVQMNGGVEDFDWENNTLLCKKLKKQSRLFISQTLSEQGGVQQPEEFKILKSQYQVVAGMKLILTVEAENRIFDITVLSQPWTGEKFTLLEFSEQEQQQEEVSMTGGLKEFNWESNDFMTGALRKSTDNFIASTLSEQGVQNKEYKVVKAQYQVVSGLRLILVVESEGRTFVMNLYTQPWTQQPIQLEAIQEVQTKQQMVKKNLRQQVSYGFERAPEMVEDFQPEPVPTGKFQSVEFESLDQMVRELVLSALDSKIDTSKAVIEKVSYQVVEGYIVKMTLSYEGQQYEALIHVVPFENSSNLVSFKEI